MRRLAPLIALATALAAGPGPGARPARAAPTIDIKAQTQLVLEKVRLLADGEVEVRGALVDRLTGDGLADQTVTIHMGDGPVTATTGPDGKFKAIVPHPAPGEQPIELSFAGGPLLDKAEPFQTTTDPARAQVALGMD